MSKQTRIRTSAQEIRQIQQRAERRRTGIVVAAVAGGLIIIGLVAAIAIVVVRSATKDDRAVGALVTPTNVTASGAIPIGQPSAPVTVSIYQDYMCPACGKFEKANAGELDRLVRAGTVKLELYPIAFLDDQSSGTKYSTRASNAVATVADRAPESVWALSTALYEQQPREGSRGLSDKQINALAGKAGVPQDVVNAFSKRTFDRWVAKATDAVFESGIKGTPTVKINNKVFSGDVYTTGPLTKAIEQAAGGTK